MFIFFRFIFYSYSLCHFVLVIAVCDCAVLFVVPLLDDICRPSPFLHRLFLYFLLSFFHFARSFIFSLRLIRWSSRGVYTAALKTNTNHKASQRNGFPYFFASNNRIRSFFSLRSVALFAQRNSYEIFHSLFYSLLVCSLFIFALFRAHVQSAINSNLQNKDTK